MANALNVEKMLEMIRNQRDYLSDIAMMNAVLGKPLFESIRQGRMSSGSDLFTQQVPRREQSTLFGMNVRESTLFSDKPVQCHKCNGTGEGGNESTYCQSCKGGGAIVHLGMMYNDPVVNFFGNNMTDPKMVLLVDYLPRKFDVGFPADVSVPLRKIPDRPTYVLRPAS